MRFDVVFKVKMHLNFFTTKLTSTKKSIILSKSKYLQKLIHNCDLVKYQKLNVYRFIQISIVRSKFKYDHG